MTFWLLLLGPLVSQGTCTWSCEFIFLRCFRYRLYKYASFPKTFSPNVSAAWSVLERWLPDRLVVYPGSNPLQVWRTIEICYFEEAHLSYWVTKWTKTAKPNLGKMAKLVFRCRCWYMLE